MVTEKTWEEFYEDGLLWWINTFLHMFGWEIVCNFDSDKKISCVYPARVKFRGFDESSTDIGYKKVSSYLARNAVELEKEAYGE